MKTKKIKYTENMSVVFDKETKNKIIELAIQNNQSQGEFVREAVEFYIKYLNSINDTTTNTVIDNKESNPRIGSSFDEFFDNEFFNN